MEALLNIGKAAEASGVSAKMIRHYEEIGLIVRAHRTEAGYRLYTQDDVHVLRFIRHCRGLGFSIHEISALLELWRDKKRPSRKVREVALTHIADLDRKIKELMEMKTTLSSLVASCHGDDRTDCPILDELEREDQLAKTTASAGIAKPALKTKAPKHGCH